MNQNPDIPIDALPYIDEYDDETKQQVLALIAEEMQTFTPGDYLPPEEPFRFQSELLQREWERMLAEEASAKEPVGVAPLDISRYASPRPSPQSQKSAQEWQHALDNSLAQLEQQRTRFDNLELALHYGSHAWRLYNERLEDHRKRLQKHAEELNEQITNVNIARKSKQHKSTFERLENEWLELVKKNVEIENACEELEREIQELNSQQ